MTTEAQTALSETAQTLAKRAIAALEGATSLTINEPHEYENAASVLVSIGQIEKQLEDARFAQTRPIDQQKKSIMDAYRPATDAVTRAKQLIRKAMAAYQDAERRKQAEAQAAAEAEARRQQEKLEKRAERFEEKGNFDRADELRRQSEMTAAPVVAADIPKVAGIATGTVWKFEVIKGQEHLIPREYLSPDEKKIGGVVRSLKGDANIPGVRVWPETSVVGRGS